MLKHFAILSCLSISSLHAEPITNLGVFPVNAPKEVKAPEAAIQHMSRESIEKTNKQDLSSFLKSEGGIAIKQAGGIGSPTSIEIRGLKHEYGGVFHNGLSLSDPSTVANDAWIDGLLLDDIDHIQIIKGPHYLKSPDPILSGAVLLNKARPKAGWQSHFLQNYGSQKLAHHNGIISYGAPQFDVRLDGARLFTQGHEKLIDQFKHKQKRHYLNQKTSFDTTINPSDRFSLSATSLYQHENQNIDNRFGFHDHFRHRLFLGRGEAEIFMLDNNAWSQKIGFSQTYVKRHYHSFGKDPYKSWGGKTIFDYQSRLRLSDHAQMEFGGEKVLEDGHFSKDFKKKQKRNGFYAEMGLTPFQWLRHKGGFRYYSHVDNKLGYSLLNEADLWGDYLSLNANMARGFKRPSFYQLYYRFSGNLDLRIQENRSFDIGLKTAMFEKKLKWGINFFLNKLYHPIDYDYASSRYISQKNYQTKGFELSNEFQLCSFLKTGLIYQFVQNKLKINEKSPLTPRHILRGHVEINPIQDLVFCVAPRRQSRYVSGPKILKAYFVTDASFTYKIKNHVGLHGKIDNAFNKKYEEVYDNRAQPFAMTFGVSIKG